MITDMENGEIEIIVTKGRSRLVRNQLHTGLYMEERFPMFGVRYIAIEECLVFENTHPAISSKKIWDIVQRVRRMAKPAQPITSGSASSMRSRRRICAG